MKKILLGTSAVALASAFANSAYAVDWEVRVGGYMEQYAAWASPDVDGLVDDDFDGIDSKMDAEVHFVPSITLDNGLKIGADVQLEGNTDGSDQIDESFLFIDGAFGRVLLGSENSAGYLMNYGAPDVTFLNVNSGSLVNFIPFSGTAFGEVGDDVDDDGLTWRRASACRRAPTSSAARWARPSSRTAATTTRSASPTSRRASPGSSSASPMRGTRARTTRTQLNLDVQEVRASATSSTSARTM